jgi:glycosyltransferase involved in cell wall biosynthesis
VRAVVHTKHGNYSYPKRTLLLARGAARAVHHFVGVSAETAAAAARNERPRRDALSVIENGIPLGAFKADTGTRTAVRRDLGIAEEALVVGSVGRLVDDKDYPLLVRAMTPLLSERVRLVLVGEGVARAKIEAAIEPAHRPFVHLLGVRHDIPRVLAAFDLFASSSRTEGLPLAIPEAMTSSLPVVATAVGGVPSIVPEGTGVLVSHGDVDALRREIQRLLEEEPRRKKMGEVARAYALSRFSEERMLDEYLALYDAR